MHASTYLSGKPSSPAPKRATSASAARSTARTSKSDSGGSSGHLDLVSGHHSPPLTRCQLQPRPAGRIASSSVISSGAGRMSRATRHPCSLRSARS